MSFGEGLSRGLLTAAQQIGANRRQARQQEAADRRLNARLAGQQNLLNQRQQQEQAALLQFGQALKNAGLVQGDLSPQDLGQLSKSGALNALLRQQNTQQEEKELQQILSNPNLDENTRLALTLQAAGIANPSSSIRLPGQIAKDKASTRLTQTREARVNELLPLEKESKRANINSRNASASASLARANQIRTVPAKGKKASADNGKTDEEIAAELAKRLGIGRSFNPGG